MSRLLFIPLFIPFAAKMANAQVFSTGGVCSLVGCVTVGKWEAEISLLNGNRVLPRFFLTADSMEVFFSFVGLTGEKHRGDSEICTATVEKPGNSI